MIQFPVKLGAAITACVAACVIASPVARAQKPPSAPPVAPPPTVTAATLDRVRTAGAIKLGYRADARPFSFTDNARQPTGYAVALCQRVAGAVKAQPGFANIAIEWKPVTNDKRFSALRQGDIDLYCGPDAISLTARREIAFSVPVFPGGVGALLRSDASDRLREALSGRAEAGSPLWRASAIQAVQSKGFAVVRGTATEQWLNSRMKDLNVSARISTVPALDAGVQAVLTGNADVFFAERSVLLDAARLNRKPGELVVLDRLFTYTPLAMAFRRGDDDFRLFVDRTLSALYASGEINTIYAKWFGEPDESAKTFFLWNTLPN